MQAHLGQTIHGYQIKHPLGEGGMSYVYYAENALEIPAAIKILKPEFSQNDDAKRRFLQEAKTMVLLKHPNIRKVMNFSIEDLAIIMEYLEGIDLHFYLQNHGAVPEPMLREWLKQILLALHYAHQQGVVHRDIKPSNIMLLKSGKVKLMDFGIAKIVSSIQFTQAHQIMGSPIYMSPEQISQPIDVDWPSDMYSLGVTIHALLNGKEPYHSESLSLYQIQHRIVNESLLINGEGLLQQLIQELTIKDWEKRLLSPQEMLRRLEAAPIEATPHFKVEDNTLPPLPEIKPPTESAATQMSYGNTLLAVVETEITQPAVEVIVVQEAVESKAILKPVKAFLARFNVKFVLLFTFFSVPACSYLVKNMISLEEYSPFLSSLALSSSLCEISIVILTLFIYFKSILTGTAKLAALILAVAGAIYGYTTTLTLGIPYMVGICCGVTLAIAHQKLWSSLFFLAVYISLATYFEDSILGLIFTNFLGALFLNYLLPTLAPLTLNFGQHVVLSLLTFIVFTAIATELSLLAGQGASPMHSSNTWWVWVLGLGFFLYLNAPYHKQAKN